MEAIIAILSILSASLAVVLVLLSSYLTKIHRFKVDKMMVGFAKRANISRDVGLIEDRNGRETCLFKCVTGLYHHHILLIKEEKGGLIGVYNHTVDDKLFATLKEKGYPTEPIVLDDLDELDEKLESNIYRICCRILNADFEELLAENDIPPEKLFKHATVNALYTTIRPIDLDKSFVEFALFHPQYKEVLESKSAQEIRRDVNISCYLKYPFWKRFLIRL